MKNRDNTIYGRAMILLIITLVTFGAYRCGFDRGHHHGYVQAELDLTQHHWTYEDVVIIARHDDRNFTLQPARMLPFEATTCTPVDWQVGEKMIKLHFQQQANCKDVVRQGWYVFYSDAKGRRIR